MPRVWVSLGSNQARESSLAVAISRLRAHYGEQRLSPVYESEALGFTGEPFLNLVAGFETTEGVAQLRLRLHAIEDDAGRVRGPDKFAPRTLDLDLLTYGEVVGTLDGYQLPRDEILRYAFVLKPLADVAATERHPATGRTYRDLWLDFRGNNLSLRPVALELGGAGDGDRPQAPG